MLDRKIRFENFENYRGLDTVTISPVYACTCSNSKIVEEYFSYQNAFPIREYSCYTSSLECFDFHECLKYFMTSRVGADDYIIEEYCYSGLTITYQFRTFKKEIDVQVTINGITVLDEDLKKIFEVVEN